MTWVIIKSMELDLKYIGKKKAHNYVVIMGLQLYLWLRQGSIQ
jgi:hypothetical protein